ncbi:MAG: hypothetical protein UX31_C0042G0002 [Candidatus Nomurabacteria bacterium GW2011_GWA1_46_11]|uniref:Uncharacterized protein n=1 Tax=Candidatus Nomurabacteria bacterium GW2011_GWA1_46_11 TaxID=1618732 RepID=A0A0G1NJ43_9BACT|nr:MAG: hypothetical protein UW69_C0015G0006 [Microgenomates group bacterium GW2011_GWA2_44_7]KKT77916.1 MAG: hypothetical protein UW73_C0009G0015 [Microgenomates group bacterium GW2011_GWB1_44_8]KKU20367.1 MAG: hypothetical protein UX31_C0042G0002 [Candidatus Nomurabacteria bacterium GW2011_GWA1_46_11]
MTRRGFAAPFVLIGVLVLLVAVGGAYYLGKSSPSPTLPQPATSTPAPLVVDPTANWKMYTNTKYGYGIKYPPRWVLMGPDQEAKTSNFTSIRESAKTYPLHDIAIQSYGPSTDKDIEQFKQLTVSWVWKDKPSQKSILVNGVEAWVKEGLMNFSDGKLYWRKYILVQGKNNLIEVSWWDSSDRSQETTFNQILSTFKFTDQKSVSESDKNAILTTVSKYIKSKGSNVDNFAILGPDYFSSGVFSVVIKDKNAGPSDPGPILVGKVNGQWVVASGYDANQCRWLREWIRESSPDEATKAYMGYTDHCK